MRPSFASSLRVQLLFAVGVLALAAIVAVALATRQTTRTEFRRFQELERAGVVTARRGKGMEVTPDAPAKCRQKRREIIQEHVRKALQEALLSGLTCREIRQFVEDELGPAESGDRSQESGIRPLRPGPARDS